MRRDVLIGLVLALLTLGVYWPVRTHDFIFYDDPQFIAENTQIRSGLSADTIKYAFTKPVVGNWHPITTLSHALDCTFFGVKPAAHHLVNTLIHAVNAALLFLLVQQLITAKGSKFGVNGAEMIALVSGPQSATGQGELGTREARPSEMGAVWLSGIGALLFALHPLRVESVAWIAERKDVLSGFFFLLTLLMYTRYAQTREHEETYHPEKSTQFDSKSAQPVRGESEGFTKTRNGRQRSETFAFYFAALACFGLGLMSKPMVVTLPFVLLLLDFWPLRRFEISNFKSQILKPARLVLEKLPFFALSAIDCWITLRVQKTAGAMQMITDVSWSERLANAVTSYVRYLGKFFWPTNLAIVYPHPAKHYFLSDAWPDWEVGVSGLLLVFLTLFCLVQARQRPYLLVGWFWYLGTLVPVIGLVQVGEQAMADRYTYIPLIGPVISLVCWLGDICLQCKTRAGLRRLIPAAGVCVTAALIFTTRHQLGYWYNTVTLFDHAIAVTADNPSAQFALGVGLEKQGELGKAMVRYRVATAIDPNYGKAYYNMGQLLRKQGHWPQAVEAYLAAARCNPNDLPTQLNLASALPHVGRNPEAVTHFEQALALDSKSIEALNNLAWLLSTNPDPQARNGSRAVQLAEQACRLTQFQAPFLLGTLAAAYAEAGRFNEAVLTGERACSRATEAGDLSTAAKNKELLEFYRANRPYREAP